MAAPPRPVYINAPISEDARAKLRAHIDRDEAQSRAAASRRAAEQTRADERAATERRARGASAHEQMQERQRAALRGGKA